MCFHCDKGNRARHIPTEKRLIGYGWSGTLSSHRVCSTCDKPVLETQIQGKSPHWCGDSIIMIDAVEPILHPAAEIVGGAPHGFGIWIDGKFHRVDIGAPGKVIADLQAQVEQAKKEKEEFEKLAMDETIRAGYLEEWKASALTVIPDWQEIGNELNLPIGAHVSGVLLEEIKKLKARATQPKFKKFEEFFDDWDQTHDPEIRRLCKVAWEVSRLKEIK